MRLAQPPETRVFLMGLHFMPVNAVYKRKVKCFCSVRISRKSDVFLSVSCMRPRSAESLSEHFCYYNNKNVSLRQALQIKGRMRYTLENHRFLCLRTEQIIITFLLYNEVQGMK